MWPVLGGILSVAAFIGFFFLVGRLLSTAQRHSRGYHGEESSGWWAFFDTGNADGGHGCDGGGHDGGGADCGDGDGGGGGE